MTEIGEKVNQANIKFEKGTCPFCNKPEHPWEGPKKKKVDISKIKSKPKKLGCGSLKPKESEGKYGRARHHMIPVHQCYTRLWRIAEMGESVGYDINGKQNGIPLPTVWNKYNVDGVSVNFGDIKDEAKKNEIRWAAMKATGAQWHVGNHHYDVPEKEDTTEDMDDEGELNHQPYDSVVLRKLLKIADKVVSKNFCETEDQDKVKLLLDELCKQIKKNLNAFGDNPKNSYPYYVSRVALDYEN